MGCVDCERLTVDRDNITPFNSLRKPPAYWWAGVDLGRDTCSSTHTHTQYKLASSTRETRACTVKGGQRRDLVSPVE
ncbi:hypothetical protein AFLA_005565 [Aspergillus flavus NRRL3357]|nr:hypothetical protein AFLA_005565 [Aspergillus flavus NRRL3357]